MKTVIPAEIKPEKRDELLNIISHINISKICKEVGVKPSYVFNVLKGATRTSNRYALALEVIKRAKAEYDEKMSAIEQINSL